MKFQYELREILSKFGESHTIKSGQEELKKLLCDKVEDASHMNLFLNSLTDFNEHIKES